MKSFILAWFAAAIVFLGLDAIWLTQVAPRFTRPIIGALLRDGVRPWPGVAFYLIYITGLVALAVEPTAETAVSRAALRGGMLGVVAYATYDLTNQATLRVWSTSLTLADIFWGAAISAVAAGAARVVTR